MDIQALLAEREEIYSLERLNSYQELADITPTEYVRIAALDTVRKIVEHRGDVTLDEATGVWVITAKEAAEVAASQDTYLAACKAREEKERAGTRKACVKVAEHKTVLRKLIKKADGFYIRFNHEIVKVGLRDDFYDKGWYLESYTGPTDLDHVLARMSTNLAVA